jgi:spore maturation protein CgeB
MRAVYADENSWFDRFIIHRVNKLAHNFRLIPKSRNFFEDHPKSHMNFRSARLRAAIEDYDPDLLFVIRGLGFRRSAYEPARTKFAWWVEGDDRLSEVREEIEHFDHYFLIHAKGLDTVRKVGGARTSYLSHAVEPAVFCPLKGVERDLDFCFVGSWSDKRQRLIEEALRVSRNGAVYGPKWYRKSSRTAALRRIVKGRYIAGEPLVQLYNRSKVVINLTWWGSGPSRSGLNMRLFEVPATGALLLTDSSEDMHRALTPGVHAATFSDIDDFREKLRFYLEHPSERERIALQGMEHVRAHHTYDHMVRSILDAYRVIAASRLTA